MNDRSKYPAWEKTKRKLKETVGWAIAVLAILGIGSYLTNFGVSYRGWVAFNHNVELENVYEDPKPHDCEWDSAPLGSKHCHYESRVVQTYGQGNHVDDRKIKFAIEWQKIEE